MRILEKLRRVCQLPCVWLMKKERKKYIHTAREVAQREKLTKKDAWESGKQMLNKFSEEECCKHLESGRIVYRPDPAFGNTKVHNPARRRLLSQKFSGKLKVQALVLCGCNGYVSG